MNDTFASVAVTVPSSSALWIRDCGDIGRPEPHLNGRKAATERLFKQFHSIWCEIVASRAKNETVSPFASRNERGKKVVDPMNRTNSAIIRILFLYIPMISHNFYLFILVILFEYFYLLNCLAVKQAACHCCDSRWPQNTLPQIQII